MAFGSARSVIVGTFDAISRITTANEPRCRKTLTRNRAISGIEYDRSADPCSCRLR